MKLVRTDENTERDLEIWNGMVENASGEHIRKRTLGTQVWGRLPQGVSLMQHNHITMRLK